MSQFPILDRQSHLKGFFKKTCQLIALPHFVKLFSRNIIFIDYKACSNQKLIVLNSNFIIRHESIFLKMSDEEYYYDESDLELTDEQLEDDFDFYNDTSNYIHKHKSYEVLSEEEVKSQTKTCIKDIVDVLGLPSRAYAPILLRYFKYDIMFSLKLDTN